MSFESFHVVVCFFFVLGEKCRNLGTGSEGQTSVHAFQVIEFLASSDFAGACSSKSSLKGSHFNALEQHLAPNTTLKFGHLRKRHAEHHCPKLSCFSFTC